MLDISNLIKLDLSGLAFRIILAIDSLKLETQKEIDTLFGFDNRQIANKVLNILVTEGILEVDKVIGRTKFYKITSKFIIKE